MSTNNLGRYQIIREIARSNDIVYEAIDTSINRRVALKELLLPPNLVGAQKRERVERFYREARAAGSLSHPNIVTIFEAGEDHGRHFIAMEYLEGKTLRDILDVEGSLPIERVVEITAQVCEGLAYAHLKGIVHRDIKPDNVQILPSGSVKITDFGIARIMEEPTLTADGQVFGTPSYMSPEQVAGKTLDRRTDIFSLGVMLFEMLAGRKPFTGDTIVTITYNIMNQEVTIPPSVPVYMERVIKRCIAKDPELRYTSAADVAADLDPNNFHNIQAAPPPDPFSMTAGMPGTSSGTLSNPQPSPAPDPFARLKPGDLSMPKLPSKPLLSPEARYFLKVLFTVLFICTVVIMFVWALSEGYKGYQRTGRTQEVSIHMDAGKKYFDSQSYQAAIEEYSKALTLSAAPAVQKTVKRNIATAYIQLGVDVERTGNFLQAVNLYNQALAYDETYSDTYLSLGNALYKMHRDEEALAAWEKAVQYGEGDKSASAARQGAAVMYNDRGDQEYRQGNTDLALQWWRHAVEIAPGTQAGFIAQDKIDRVMGR